MDSAIKEQIVFALEDDNELMQAAIGKDSDLDPEDQQMNRELIKRHREILAKLDRGEPLSQEDLLLIHDANEIHVNDAIDLGGRHQEALALDEWLDNMMELSMEKAMAILEEWLDRDPKTPARAYRTINWKRGSPSFREAWRRFNSNREAPLTPPLCLARMCRDGMQGTHRRFREL